MSNIYQIYLISDSTGETLDRIFTAIKAQFKNIDYKIHTYSFTRTENQILKILSNAQENQNSIIEHLENIITHSIGYYSIALTFQFKFKPLFLNPVWTVIVYSHENPPKFKSIVEINAYNLDLINDVYTEDVFDA